MMDELIKLNNQTSGRDKFARLLQYASRIAWHMLQQNNMSRNSVDTLKNLEYTFSTFRKLLRLGRFFDTFYGALSTIHYPDPVLRMTCTLSKIAYSLFLFCDHILWIGRVGVMDVNIEKWATAANKYWLHTVVLNLARDYYEMNRIIKACANGKSTYFMCSRRILYVLLHCHKDIIIDTVKNICDIFIPLSALGYMKVSPGVVGLLGVMSSLAGIISLIDPMAKLTPA